MTSVPSSFLVLPTSNDRTVARLQVAVRKIALKQLLTYPAARLDPDLQRVLPSVRRVLTAILKRAPQRLMDALGNVDVLTPLLILDVGPHHTDTDANDLLRSALPPLLLHLSHRARATVPEAMLLDLDLSMAPDAVGQRLFRFDPPARGLLLDPMGAEFGLRDESKVRLPAAPKAPADQEGLTTERPFHRLHAELPYLQLSLHDSNPLSMYEAHPDKDGNAISLGDKPREAWTRSLHEALELIRIALPTWFAEIKTSMRRLVPVGYLPERHLSASYREAPGVAYLTLCDNPLTMAEAIIHETQHTKANLMSWVDPIVHNAHTCWTESPVRPDLRPLWGVLLAVHAFVPVSALHHRLAELDHPVTRTERFPRRRAEVLAGNHHGMRAVLDNAEGTASGTRLIREMSALHEFLRTHAPPAPAGLDIDPDILPPS